ncbi:HpcH/HpaI aldolase/citrate lyase family protein [Ottowia caeni]|uniref:HpcH/HpaI aldolase/citrate lyase family protein n=1 Tax=Ottowia caeni TaxID=2870339 RepID=UPI001E46342A|nr:CoA ester lyase [Ottowia caeni]
MTGQANLPLRSLLFVPGDSERKLLKGADSLADALILDLEDAVAPSRTHLARGMVVDYLKSRPDRTRQKLWVRINPLDTSAAMLDLAAVVAGAPDGILLPKVNGPADVTRLSHCLDALEVREGLSSGQTSIMPVATETPQSLFALGSYAGSSTRLHGLTWGAEDIAAALGASANRRPTGEYDTVYSLAKALCLAGAVAANVQPVDTIWGDYRDSDGLKNEAQQSRRSGYTGKIAIHPGQVDAINEAFTPAAEEVAWSRRVVEAFAANPGIGTVGIEGKMLDMPHLKQARRVLELVERVGKN